MSNVCLKHENYEKVIHSIYISGGYIILSKDLIKDEVIEKDNYIDVNFYCDDCGGQRMFRFLILDVQPLYVLLYTFIKIYTLN